MNYYGSKELSASFRTVRSNTIIIADEIGDEHYGFSAASGTRTVGQMLTHIALATRFTLLIHGTERRVTLQGFDFPGFFSKMRSEEQSPREKEQILTMLRDEGERYATWLEGVSEELLGEHVSFPFGPSKSRFEMILGVKEHEMHHRAQLMLIERMIGIVPHVTRQAEARMAAMQAAKTPA